MGLVARSYWISHDQAIAAHPDNGIPLASARVIGPDREEAVELLAPALAAEQGLKVLRVLWVRTPGDISGMAEAMARTEASIRRLIPQQGLEAAFTELLVPETLRDLAIPLPPPDWQQFVVEPRDRPSPSSSDAYYNAETAPRQGLHAALMIGGILGGHNLVQPAPRDARTNTPWVVHPFTRAIRGADRARREARAVLRDRLATISAADVAPDRFFAPEHREGSEYVDDAVTWLRDLDDQALRFDRPEVSFHRRGQTFLQFLVEVLHFLGWALKGMFGLQRWKDIYLAIRARIARRLEAVDYGSTIDANAPTPKGLDLEDWDAREAEARAEAMPKIAAAARFDGKVPDRSVWLGIARMIPSLIDGSVSPTGWIPRKRFEHVYVLPPQEVVRTETNILEAAGKPTGSTTVAAIEEELRGVRRIGEHELARARELAGIGLEHDLARFDSPTGAVTKTAHAISEQAQIEADERRQEYSEALRSSGGNSAAAGELPLLGRLRSGVVADLLLARLSADQLSSMTPTTVPNALPRIRRMLHDATWVVLGIVLIGVGLIALLLRFSQEIDAVFDVMRLDYPTSWTHILWWLVSALSAILVFIFTRLFYEYHVYNEVGRRRLEYTERRADAAIAAWGERNRLRNAERILAAWEDILSSIGTRDDQASPPLALVPGDLPTALQVAEPDIDDDELSRLVIEEAIEPEWFGNAFKTLISRVLDKDRSEALWSDTGLRGGPLTLLQTAALEGEIQRDWWDDWGTRVANKVVSKLAAESRRVRPVAASRSGTLAADEFRTEITREMTPEYRPGWDYEELFDSSDGGARVTASARQGSDVYVPTPALTAVDTVLISRRLQRIASATTPTRNTDKSGDSDESRVGRA